MKGYIERRANQRAPFETEIMIHLEEDGQVLCKARMTNISAGGIEFEMSVGGPDLGIGTIIEFFFDLPLLGRTILQGEIRFNRLGLDNENTPVPIYGVKFLNLPLETWNYIVDYCKSREIPAEPEAPTLMEGPVMKMNDLDSNSIDNQLAAELLLRDGSSVSATIISFNIGGLTFMTREPQPDNTRLTIRLATSTNLIYLPGVSVWCNPTEDSGFQIGVNFVHISSEQTEQLQMIINQIKVDS